MEIVEANEDHLEAVNEFLQGYFFTREPLGLRFGIDPVKDTNDWLSQVTRPLLLQKVKLQIHENMVNERKLQKSIIMMLSYSLITYSLRFLVKHLIKSPLHISYKMVVVINKSYFINATLQVS